MLFISDAQYYVPVKLSKMAGSIDLFKFTGKLSPQDRKLKRNILWNVIEFDWKDVNMTLNGNKKIYQLQSLHCLELNSKLDTLANENPCFFILCLN